MAKLNQEVVKQSLLKQLDQVPDKISILGRADRPNSWTFQAIFSGEECVIKVIKPARRDGEVYSEAEEEALDRIKSRKDINAVPYIEKGVITISGTKLMYFVFPFIPGNDLDKYISKNEKISEEVTLKILVSLVSTILRLSEEGIIHQDIKPANIKVQEDGTVTLLDFGIARFIDYDHALSKQQGPARYLSPEQVDLGLDRIPKNQRKITLLSDVYSACVVALNMLLGKDFYSLWKPDQRQKIVDEIASDGFIKIENVELKNFLMNGLQPLISRRSNIFSLLDAQLTNSLSAKKPGFKTLWNLQHWTTGSEILTTFAKENPEIREGVVFLSEHIRSVEKDIVRAGELLTMGWRVAVDPSTYKLQFREDHYAKIEDREYFRSNVKPVQFYNPLFLSKFVSDVLDFQKLFDPSVYISPYFFIDDNDSEYVDINFNLFEEAKRQLSNSSVPLLFGLAISEKIIQNPKKLDELLSQLMMYPGTNAYYLRAEMVKPNNQACSNEEFLKGLLRLTKGLTISKSIILSQLDQLVIGLFANSKLSVAISPEASARKNDIEVKHLSEKSSGGPKQEDKRTWVYIPALISDVDLQRDLRRMPLKSFSRNSEIFCSCKYCEVKQEGIDPLANNSNRWSHFLLNFYNQVGAITKASDREKAFTEMLDKANDLFDSIDQENIILDGENEGNFLKTWREVFTSHQ